MTESPGTMNTEAGAIQRPVPGPGSPTFAMVAIAIGAGYILALLLFGFLGVVLAVPACTVVFAGLVSAVLGLARKRNRQGPYRRRYIAVFVANLGLAILLLMGLGSIRALNLRSRMRVAMTGGQDELQSWALELMAKPREELGRTRS